MMKLRKTHFDIKLEFQALLNFEFLHRTTTMAFSFLYRTLLLLAAPSLSSTIHTNSTQYEV
jgi:hypothetical protein